MFGSSAVLRNDESQMSNERVKSAGSPATRVVGRYKIDTNAHPGRQLWVTRVRLQAAAVRAEKPR
jgi:hypothetical protein